MYGIRKPSPLKKLVLSLWMGFIRAIPIATRPGTNQFPPIIRHLTGTPKPSDTRYIDLVMPLYRVEATYQAIQMATIYPD